MQQKITGFPSTSLRIAGWACVALLLAAPLIAMQFTPEVNWSAGDFLLAALLLGGAGLAFEVALRKSGNLAYRIGAMLGVGGSLLLIVANLAVGIAGAESDPANLWFMAVPLVGVVGLGLAGLRAGGLVITMLAMVTAQVVAGLLAGMEGDVVPATIGFGLCWFAAAWQFRKAA